MKLSFQQIKLLTKGAVSIEETNLGIQFRRYTQNQLAAFEKEARCFFKRAQHTCGIRIDFYTDSPSLSVCIGAAGKYEVLIDNLTAFMQTYETPDTFTVDLGFGMKRVTIILPSHTNGVIRSVALADGASVMPVDHPIRIIFYGDSITQGWDSEKDSQSYAWLVTRYFDADSMILGVGGANFFPDTVEDNGFDADIVIIALGTNDFLGELPLQAVQSACAAYLDRLCDIYAGKKMFYITPLWRADGKESHVAGTMADIRNAVAQEAQKRNMVVIDGLSMIPHRIEYFADGFLHPNDMGFSLFAQNLTKALKQHL